jgi:hypothetical protein
MEGVYGDAHDLWINPNDTRIMTVLVPGPLDRVH